MMMNTRTIAAATIGALGLAAGCAMSDDVALTIYSTATPGAINPDLYRPVPGNGSMGYTGYRQIPGYAIVKQERELDIERGVSSLNFQGVAALLDPTTVHFESLTDPDGTTVLEQDYRFDLLSMDKMLERYIDKEIVLNGNEVTLMSVSGGGMLIQGDDGAIQFVSGYDGVKFPAIADGLITRPTLNWMISSRRGGEQDTRISYETKGITWWADYNLIYEEGRTPNEGTIDLSAWVSILNQSGGSYEDANLKLVAGDVNRAPTGGYGTSTFSRGNEMMMADTMQKGFEEKSFFEYHLYTLGRPTTIPDRSTKQIELFEQATDIPVKKRFMFDGTSQYMYYGGGRQENESFGIGGDTKVQVFLQFDNKEDEGLGMPLPSGRVRVSQLDDADGSFEFIGEDTIDHTPRNEEVTIKIGNAFDVVGERRQVSFERGNRWMTETIEVKIRNQKEEAVEVHIQEHLYRWSNAKITEISHDHEMLDSRTMHIPVTVDSEDEEVVTYTVHYTW
ncbi:MAG: DUF4139 domain-containing protein [Phycisphaerales bacterium JB052]